MRPEKVAAILLAAGTSSRFGQDDKLMAEYRGKPLAVHALEMLASIPFAHHIAVVREAALAPVLHRKLDRRDYQLVVNPQPEEGLASSIVRGVAHAAGLRCQGVLICLGDMPHVPQSHVIRICLAAQDIRSVVASTDGFACSPPAFFGRRHFDELLALRGDQGARALMSHGMLIETGSALLRDIDVPGDLESE